MVKAINVLIALAAAAVLAGLYWYIWRPLPQRSGAVDVPTGAPATVSFDRLGVPHIHAASQEDAFIAQGYVTAQDRLWQMDSLRRLAGGNLAEIVGPGALELDRESRQLTSSPHRRSRLHEISPGRSCSLRRIHPGSQPVHRHSSRRSACRVYVAWLSAANRGARWIACWSASTCIAVSPPPGAPMSSKAAC